MLNARITRIVFVLLLIVPFFTHWNFWQQILFYVLVLASYLAVLAYGSYFIQSGFYLNALCRGDKKTKQIALTFDDGPHQEFTPRLLALLKSEKAPATFFLIGKNIAGNEQLLQQMVNEGHIVANHSYEHSYWYSLNNHQAMWQDLQRCDEAIFRAVQKTPAMFRPPYGVTNPMVAKVVKNGNYHCIGWSIRTYDTQAKNAEQLLQKSIKNLSNGDIILFHDWGAHTIGILSAFIKEARNRGYTLVTADKLLNINPYR